MKILVFDIGGTSIKWGIVNNIENNISNNGSFETEALKNKASGILNLVVDFYNNLQNKSEIEGIGISIPGAVNFETSTIVSETQNIPESAGMNVKKYLEDKGISIPIMVDNDVNVAALGEMSIGTFSKQGINIMATIGTGIGGAIFIDGNLIRGKDHLAGEIGRQIIGGNKWEFVASTKALTDSVSKKIGKEYDGVKVIKEITINNDVKNVYNIWLDNLAKGFINLVVSLNPSVIVIGGGISEADDFDTISIKEAMKKYVAKEFIDSFEIKKAKLGNKAALIGTAALFNK